MSVNRVRIALLVVLALTAAGLGIATWAPAREVWDTYIGEPLAELGHGEITVTALFQDSVGLYEGNEVTVLGMPVGTVTHIEPRGTRVVVEMTVDDTVELPADVGAVTVSPSVVTNRNVELTPVYRGGPKLADGAVIPLERTRTPVEFGRVIAAVDELAGELSKTENGKRVLAEGLDVAAERLRGNGKDIRKALRSLAAAVESGAKHRDPLVRLIKEVDRLTTTAAENKATIRSFSQNLTATTELFAEQAPELRRMLTQINKMLAEAQTLVEDNAPAIKATLRNARTTSETLARHTGQIAETLDTLPLGLQNLLRAVDQETGELRVHVNLDQMIADQYQTVCDLLGLTAPGCEANDVGGLPPDLGITAIFEKVMTR